MKLAILVVLLGGNFILSALNFGMSVSLFVDGEIGGGVLHLAISALNLYAFKRLSSVSI